MLGLVLPWVSLGIVNFVPQGAAVGLFLSGVLLQIFGFFAAFALYRRRWHPPAVSPEATDAGQHDVGAAMREEMRDLLGSTGSATESPVVIPAGEPTRRFFYVESLKLRNIRCFDRLELGFGAEDGLSMTSLILGDNSTGKSTILRSLAIGLCPESDAVSLMTSLESGLLRTGEPEGRITIGLRSSDGEWSGSIVTWVKASGTSTVLRQEASPNPFPWEELFLCGYGTQRTVQGGGSHKRYLGRLAVASLFGDTAQLQDPEVVLLKREPGLRAEIEAVLKQILMLDGESPAFEQSAEKSIQLTGPWGKQRVVDTSDGYRSTTQWLLDFIAWQIYARETRHVGEIGGLLLLDEIEQHLHPRWQRHVLQRLRAQLPHVQIIATTHTPLIASGATDLDRVSIHRLRLDDSGSIEPQVIDPRYLRGKRADQVLASAFGLLTSKSPRSVARMERYVHLLGREESPERDRALADLRREMSSDTATGENAFERVIETALSETLDKMIGEGNEVLDLTAKQRLHQMLEEIDEDDEGDELEDILEVE